MNPDVIEAKVEGLLEQIKREHAEHQVTIGEMQRQQFRWFAGSVIAVLLSGIGVLVAILLRILVELK